MAHSFQIDPAEVLGVDRDASLQQIRDAYRTQAQRYHPDHGGEGWAFRMVAQAYEILSMARVMRRASEEIERGRGPAPAPPDPNPSPYRPFTPRDDAREEGQLRRGVKDSGIDPYRMVLIEMFLLRFELDDVMGLLGLVSERPERRNLSCTLSVTWPPPNLADEPSKVPNASRHLASLHQTVKEAAGGKRDAQAFTTEDGGRFFGWVSFPTANRADEGFRRLADGLRYRGLGVEQWIRELILPRDWRPEPE